jgi:subtilisin family serine protease
MRRHRSVAAPWGAIILAVAVGTLGVPVARGALPADTAPHAYVVLLKDARANAGTVSEGQARKFGFKVDGLFDRGLRGYVGSMSDSAARALAAMPGVLAVAPDAKLTTFDTPTKTTQQLAEHPLYSTLPQIWGLDRIDQRTRSLDKMYSYDMTGAGVTAYIVDTGVASQHVEFATPSGTRVQPAPRRFDAYRTIGDPSYGEDCDGHGTHVAGTVGGQTFGVAKDVSIVSVRVLDCEGSGYISDIVKGIDWMIADHTGGPAVANMSFGGGTNGAIDAAVNRAIDDGISVAVAAGNDGRNACSYSPARVPRALTVGATDSNDKKASFSNYGSCLDLFAPGVSIVSSYGGTGSATTAWAQMSGTSMATPHVAGVAALILSAVPGAAPSEVGSALASVATTGVVTSSSTSSPKLLYEPSDLVPNTLPSGGGTAPPTVTTKPTTTTTTRPPTTTTTRPCFFFCFPRR